MPVAIDWMLEGPPWVQYRARLDLLGQAHHHSDVQASRQRMLEDSQVQRLIADLADWPLPPLTRHNDAGHPLHKLVFLADLGLRVEDPGLSEVVTRVLSWQAPEGAFQIATCIHQRYGGTGQVQPAWMLCDAPLVLYALASFGLERDPRVHRAAEHLVSLLQDNGWPCAVTPKLGLFRGPGRRTDPCPYANLVALKALSVLSEWRDSIPVRIGAETLLGLWETRRQQRPYLFAMGTDFAKLKAPNVWYDLLHVVDVLTRFPWLHEDERLHEMLRRLASKANDKRQFAAESIWLDWKGWEFAQKREPSRWITFLAWRALRRLESAESSR